MKRLLLGLGLMVFGAGALGASVTVTLYPDASAAPGSIFHWQFVLTNNSGYDLYLSSVDSTFPAGDGLAADDPAVTTDLDAYFLLYPDGLPNGATSAQLPLAFYSVSGGAAAGSQVGNTSGPCCLLTLSYDLFDGATYMGSSSVDSEFTEVIISGSPSFVPEPGTWVLCAAGLAAVWLRRRSGGSTA